MGIFVCFIIAVERDIEVKESLVNRNQQINGMKGSEIIQRFHDIVPIIRENVLRNQENFKDVKRLQKVILMMMSSILVTSVNACLNREVQN